ncbi:MAG: sigma-70 family RNA polymerase sigma factor [Gammaproteobacteria bacterium]|nr:sigma-70 family RNA polymerase sigma factor [Gammaproteobacteria bacterium]
MHMHIDHDGFDRHSSFDLSDRGLDDFGDRAATELEEDGLASGIDRDLDDVIHDDNDLNEFQAEDEGGLDTEPATLDDGLDGDLLDAEAGSSEGGVNEDTLTYSSYFGAARARPLLNAAQERTLGRALITSREALTEALSVVPFAWERLVAAWEEAVSGDRQISEVLQWPLGSPTRDADAMSLEDAEDDDEAGEVTVESVSVTGGMTPRAEMKIFATELAEWRERTLGWKRRGLPKPPEAGRERFVRLGPAFAMLSELRESLEELRVSASGKTASKERQRRVELRAGVTLDVLEAACEAAAEAEASFQRARRVMFESNIRLVFFIAGKFTNNGLSLDDLVQEGNIGLLRAVEKFDHRLGYKFSTYASTWIWQAVTRSIANHRRTIRVPAHLHDKMLKVRSTSNRIEQKTGKAPSLEVLAKETGLSVPTVVRAMEAGRSTLSLDAPIGTDEGTTFGDLTPDSAQPEASDPVHDEELSVYLDRLLDELPPREALIVRLRHGLGGTEPHTLEEIGAILSITRERTRQLQNRALRALKARLPADVAVLFGQAG